MTQPPGHRQAIALEYNGDKAPFISAIGDAALADQIIAIAKEHGVPLLENRELAGLLAQLDLGDEIPELLYRCVAQIIAFAYQLRGRYPQGWQPETTNPDEATDPTAESYPVLLPPR